MLVRVINGIPNLLHVVAFNQRSGWTAVYALAAVGTNHLEHGIFEKGGNFHVGTFICNPQCANMLEFFAGTHATLTTDALAVILNY